MAKYKRQEQRGFVLYIDDWKILVAACTGEEVKQLVSAAMNYFETGVIAEFDDRALRIQFHQLVKSIDCDGERFRKKCVDNAYKRYVSECKKHKIDYMDEDDWFDNVYTPSLQSTIVDDRRPQSTNINESPNVSRNVSSKESTKPKDALPRLVPPTLEEVRTYCQEQNISVDPDQFFRYYEEGHWVDGRGQPVLNWKQKLLTWEKHEQGTRPSHKNFQTAEDYANTLKDQKPVDLDALKSIADEFEKCGHG